MPAPEPSPGQWARRLGWLGVALIMAWLGLVSVALVIRTGLFDFDSDFSAGNVMAAAWAFVGSGLAAVVALVGALFTSSYNHRTLQLAQEAEVRQRHEAVAALLRVLGGDAEKGTGPTSVQITAAILTLRGLQHFDAARGILEGTIYDGTLHPVSAASLISKFLESNNSLDRLEATRLLRVAAVGWTSKNDGTFQWPRSVRQEWPEDFTHEEKTNLLVAIGSILLSQDRDWWNGKRDWAVNLLDEATKDGEESVRNGAAKLLDPLLASFASDDLGIVRAGGSRRVKDFRQRLEAYTMTPKWDVVVRQTADQLRDRWFPKQ